MAKIPTDKFKPKLGTMTARLFENPYIGLEPTLFYDITIPLEPFESGLESDVVLKPFESGMVCSEPVETSFRLDFIKFPVADWLKFDGHSFEIARNDADGSIYLGAAHNPVDIKLIRFTRLDGFMFRINCVLYCDFSFEGVADNETVDLITDIEFKGLVVGLDRGRALEIASRLVDLSCYAEPELNEGSIVLKPRINEKIA